MRWMIVHDTLYAYGHVQNTNTRWISNKSNEFYNNCTVVD